jgi:hypothetical protein
MYKKIQLPMDTDFEVQFKRANLDAVWGPIVRIKTMKNGNPPAKPSKPMLATVLGQIAIRWNGQSADGTAYLPDFNRLEIHMSDTKGFTPVPATMVDQTMHYGSNYETNASAGYNTTYYVKFVAYNTSGVASPPSDEEYMENKRISGIELEDGSINVDQVNLSRRGLRQNLSYYQPLAPSTTNNPKNPPFWNDTWFDTDDNYKYYRYDHATPFRAQGADESWEAYFDANAATTDLGWREIPIGTANQVPGARVWYQDTDPASTASPPPANGDIWFKTGVVGGTNARTWKSGAWQILQWGQGSLGPGSVVADNIVANAITASKIQTNAVTADKILSGEIIARHIQTGQITADKMAVNSITAQNAAIADAAIDNAKIANVSAGKLTAGTITAAIIISGNIRTATTGARVELNANGLWQYDASNNYNVWIGTTGYAFIRGQINATLFRSAGYQTGGSSYIEIGNTGTNDPVDEIRMFTGGAVSSIRNPSDAPGALRMSLSRTGLDTIDFTASSMLVPNNSFRIINRLYGNTFVAFDVNRIIFSSHNNAAQSFMEGADGATQNFLWRIGNDNGGAVKLSRSPARVQIRNSQDNAYGILEVGDLIVRGTYTGPSSGSATLPSDPTFNSIYVNNSINAGYVTSRGTLSASGITTASNRLNIYASDGANANIASMQGGGGALKIISFNGEIQARTGSDGSYGTMAAFIRNPSSPELKENIRQINLDAYSLIDNINFYAYDWKNDEANQEGMGFLLSELPALFTPKGSEESYAMSTMFGFQHQVMKQMKQHIIEQEYRLHQLETAVETLKEQADVTS